MALSTAPIPCWEQSMRVVLWDSHPVVRLALASLISEMGESWEAVHILPSMAEECLRHPEKLQGIGPFDLVIWDPRPSPFASLEQEPIAQVKRELGSVPLMVFTASEQPADIRAALTAGASAYVPKTTEAGLITTIIRLVQAGGLYVPPSLASSLHAQPAPVREVPQHGYTAAANSHLPELTQRQYQVLKLLSEGLSNAEIGSRLGLNISTVKSHVTSVLKTLGVERRTQAVLLFKKAEWESLV